MRAFAANVSESEGVGCCGGFAASEEAPANGFEDEPNGFVAAPDAEEPPEENGLTEEDAADGGFTPNRDSPTLDCFWGGGFAGASCAAACCG